MSEGDFKVARAGNVREAAVHSVFRKPKLKDGTPGCWTGLTQGAQRRLRIDGYAGAQPLIYASSCEVVRRDLYAPPR